MPNYWYKATIINKDGSVTPAEGSLGYSRNQFEAAAELQKAIKKQWNATLVTATLHTILNGGEYSEVIYRVGKNEVPQQVIPTKNNKTRNSYEIPKEEAIKALPYHKPEHKHPLLNSGPTSLTSKYIKEAEWITPANYIKKPTFDTKILVKKEA